MALDPVFLPAGPAGFDQDSRRAHTHSVRYEGRIFRPPSEAHSYILQATIGCSWNRCVYCDMYRDKQFRVRDLSETLADIALASESYGPQVEKVFVADGDALILAEEHWLEILAACRGAFPNLRQVSCYAMATNILEKSEATLRRLRDAGLTMLYVGPESGEDEVLKRLAKGSTAADHIAAAERARAAGMDLSVMFLLGAGGTERSEAHAVASGRLATAMDPRYLAALTVTVVEGTPLEKMQASGRFQLPDTEGLLRELRWFVAEAAPTDATFRTNHASNYLPIGGRLPQDREALLTTLDDALAGRVPLRPDWSRGL